MTKRTSPTGSKRSGLQPEQHWQQEGDNLWWIPAGTPVVVNFITIPDGMVYVGQTPSTKEPPPELSQLDPSLPVGWAPDFHPSLPRGASMLPYRLLLPSARTAYLRWLASGRKRRGLSISFVYLFFTGLESRILRNLKEHKRASDLSAIREETERLLAVYGADARLEKQAAHFLKLLTYLEDTPEQDWQLSWTQDPSPGEETYRPSISQRQPVHYRKPHKPQTVPSKPALFEQQVQPEKPAETTTAPPPTAPNTDTGKPIPTPAAQPAEKPQSEAVQPRSAPQQSDFLDRKRLAAVQDEVRHTDAFLADLYENEEDEEHTEETAPVLAPPAASTRTETDTDTAVLSRLEHRLHAFLATLITKQEWARVEVSSLARHHGLMIDGALAEINEYALDLVDMELVDEQEDTIEVDPEVVEVLRKQGALPASVETPPTKAEQQPAASSSAPPPAVLPEPPAARGQEGFWVRIGETVSVQGRKITTGLVYVGTPVDDRQAALINPDLPAESAPGTPASNHHGKGYHQLPPDARGRYLDWLAAGRIGVVSEDTPLFLFLYGLEQRVLCDILPGSAPTSELATIHAELDRLIDTYRILRRFRQRAYTLRALVRYLAQGNLHSPGKPPSPKDPYDTLPDELRYGLGVLKAHNKQIPADWALSWAVHHEQVRPPMALRTDEAFHEAFRRRFTEEFPGGMPVPFNEGKEFTWVYTPTNPDLDTIRVPVPEIYDISNLALPLSHLGRIVRAAQADVEKTKKEEARPAQPFATPLPHPEAELSQTTQKIRWSSWKAPGTTVRISKYTIPDGMVYTGYAPREADDDIQRSSAIDLSLEIDSSVVSPHGRAPRRPVAGYPDLTPQERARYLSWLANRDSGASVPIVFGRLFRNGLERRIIEMIRSTKEKIRIPPRLREELKRLIEEFAASPEFTEQTRRLLILADIASEEKLAAPSSPPRYSPATQQIPQEFRLGLGLLARDNLSLPPEWALEWVLYHLRPENPEEYRKNFSSLNLPLPYKGLILPYQGDQIVPATAPQFEYVYRASCPGLGEVRLPVPGVRDVADIAPPQDLVNRVQKIYAQAVERNRLAGNTATPSSTLAAGNLATGNTTLHSSPANRATAAPAAPKPPAVTPPPVPAPAAASQQTIRDFAELALHLASLAGPLTVEHRLLITRAAETIADLFEKDWRELRLHERETAATEPPLNLCSRLAQLPLREREKLGDLLFDVAEVGGKTTENQTVFLLSVHRILGLEAILRLRLSYRGIAPPPDNPHSGNPLTPASPDTPLTPKKLPKITPLSQRHIALLTDLATRDHWNLADTTRLAHWYGIDVYEAIDAINEVALHRTGTVVLSENDDHITVHKVIFEEMTQ